MRILVRLAALLAVCVALGACATEQGMVRSPAADYRYIYKDFDLRYAWRLAPVAEGVKVEGLIKNVRGQRMENLEVRVALLDKNHKVLGEALAHPLPQPIDSDDFRSFELHLPKAQEPGLMLRFIVNYVVSSSQGSYSWTSNFTVDAATGQRLGVQKSKDLDW
ncbi:hypothetical protein GMLC_15610 [Geomonas limicola]|uniref:Lipoprotein n=1 Tax=Geomonas limicola TaxID=2740186 RepID=A0A6V8N5Z0_9BACT|nr:FxLYD domain-containing protein [Geomonas limicola]GFO67982.1 hypothetical protein GMLC_15610 [Geomonas limicola]